MGKLITTPRRLTAPRFQTGHDGNRMAETPSAHVSHVSHNFTAAPNKDSRRTPIHGGIKPQPAGGLGHAVGAQPIDDGGQPIAAGIHPFDSKPASPQLAHGKLAPVSPGMRNRKNDHAHGGASACSDSSTGDPMDILSTADPRHPNFRGKNCGD